MNDEYDLERFVAAQAGVFDHAVAELRRARKTSHWMWFVFPQIAGLGMSATSKRYAISSISEAEAYLGHPVLGPRLLQCTGIVAAVTDRSAVQIFGGIDAQKLRSSMTLFQRADPDQMLFGDVLNHFFDGPDLVTERLLDRIGGAHTT